MNTPHGLGARILLELALIVGGSLVGVAFQVFCHPPTWAPVMLAVQVMLSFKILARVRP